MIIQNVKVLRGPNYWSNYRHKLIVMLLDLGKYEELPTNVLPNFTENLLTHLPSLYQHFCSRGKEGGLVERMREGTWLGHVIEHVALELQCLAGMDCHFGRTRSAYKERVYHVVFAYEVENAGLYAGRVAVDLVEAIAEGKTYPQLQEKLKVLKNICANEGLGPSTKAIVQAAMQRKIPVTRLDNHSLIMLGQGCHQKLISATLTSQTNIIGIDISSDKNVTKQMLMDAFIPVPRGYVIADDNQLKETLKNISFPIVIKPVDCNHGKGITTNIVSQEKALLAYQIAKRYSNNIIVESFIPGSDYRFLVINYKVVAVAKRIPAMVVGDGRSTLKELIEEINADGARGEQHENVLTTIKLDEVTLNILAEKQLTLESVLPKDAQVVLKHAANLSSGGTAIDVTDYVHPHNVLLAERAARIIGLDVCGIDIVTKDIGKTIEHGNGAVIEVNAAPGLRMHVSPTAGKSRAVGEAIVNYLFPEEIPARIPIIAVTGTNGKTTTVRLLAHFATQAGYTVGSTTTDGISINQHTIYKGDCSGPLSASAVLRDSSVNFAVFECARGGVLRAGLAFDKCNISIVTNVTDDHLGLEDIETLEDLARVKSVIPRSTQDDGYAILNADDDLVYQMREDVTCNVALFSKQEQNPRIIEHCAKGGLAAFIEKDVIVVREGNIRHHLLNLAEVPITYGGTVSCMTENILASVLGGLVAGFQLNDINAWLKNFFPDTKNLPGRMNLFQFNGYRLLLDYAHNASAMLEFAKYLQSLKDVSRKVGIIAAPGDRRDEDIKNMGFYAAQMFDDIIIRHDKDSRGRENKEITRLLKEGIAAANTGVSVSIITDEFEALEYALTNPKAGSLIVLFPEKVSTALEFIHSLSAKFPSKATVS